MNRRWIPAPAWWLPACLLVFASGAVAQQLGVQVAVEKQKVAVGEPFLFRIQVDGTNDVQPADLAGATNDFRVEFVESSSGNKSFYTNINGRESRNVTVIQYLTYRLRAKTTGTFVIPAVTVQAAGQSLRTKPVPITVTEAETSENFFLKTELSTDSCYVGEAVQLTTMFYVGQPVSEVTFDLPLLDIDGLACRADNPDQGDFEFEIANKKVVATQKQATLNGSTFVVLTFHHIITPKVPGRFELPASGATGEGATGRRVQRGGFFGGTQREYKRFFARSTPMTLDVKPLPTAGKPANFSGLVGELNVEATATPTSVNKGDPITLTVTLSGTPNIVDYELDLAEQPDLARDFQLTKDNSEGVSTGNRKQFVRTIRADESDLDAIPPIALTYFDAAAGRYAVAASKAIPISVKHVEEVTSGQLEGFDHDRPGVGVEHQFVHEGIAHNFTGAATLKPQRFGPDVWLRTTGSWLFLLVPPLLYAALAASLFLRARGGLFGGNHRRQALPAFEKHIQSLDAAEAPHGPVLDGLRTYLGTRLERPASALTYGDVEPALREGGATDATLDGLRAIFDECEAHRYAGGAATATENTAFVDGVLTTVRALDKELGR